MFTRNKKDECDTAETQSHYELCESANHRGNRTFDARAFFENEDAPDEVAETVWEKHSGSYSGEDGRNRPAHRHGFNRTYHFLPFDGFQKKIENH